MGVGKVVQCEKKKERKKTINKTGKSEFLKTFGSFEQLLSATECRTRIV